VSAPSLFVRLRTRASSLRAGNFSRREERAERRATRVRRTDRKREDTETGGA